VIAAFRRWIDTLRVAASAWVPVCERKPETYDDVLFVYTAKWSSGGSYVKYGFMNETGDWFEAHEDDEKDTPCVREHVSHWMPLPGLPSGYEPPFFAAEECAP
jgi:hypothetical protein